MTRLAVIADCHGNLDALKAILAEVDRLGVERILNLGDHASGPLDAGATLDLIQSRSDIVSIQGNHDRYLLGEPGDMGPSDAVARSELGQDHLDWLASLPATLALEDLFLCHGTPKADDRYWLEEVSAEGHVLRRNLAEIETEAAGIQAQVMLCGHSHLPAIVQISGGRLVVNPGSVGLPAYNDVRPVPHVIESTDAAARFALLERRDQRWTASLRRVAYDPSRMAALARKRGRPDWAHALETGWFGG